MSARASFPDEHLKGEERQRYSEKVHKLLVIFLKDHGIVFLILHLPDVVDDRCQAKLIVTGMNICPAPGGSDFFEGLLVKMSHRTCRAQQF